jgi:hypothetical protein
MSCKTEPEAEGRRNSEEVAELQVGRAAGGRTKSPSGERIHQGAHRMKAAEAGQSVANSLVFRIAGGATSREVRWKPHVEKIGSAVVVRRKTSWTPDATA